MIHRHIFFKLKEAHATPDAVQEIVRETLSTMPQIPGVIRVTAGTPADEPSATAWDVCFIVEFERIEDVALYASHPIHRKLVDTYIEPRLEVRKAWNFEVAHSHSIVAGGLDEMS